MSRRRTTTAATGLAVALFLIGVPCPAAQFVVDHMDDVVDAAPGDGACAVAARGGGCSLRAAIQESNALAGPDELILPAGIFLLSRAGTDEDAAFTGDLDVTDAVRIAGAGSEVTIVDAAALDRVIDLLPADSPRDVTLADLTLRNGHLDMPLDPNLAGGAGLRVGLHVHLDLLRVTVRDNRVDGRSDAIGISNRGCIEGEQVRVLDNFETGDFWSRAGGIYTDGADSCLTLVDSELRGNRGDAGAIWLQRDAAVHLRRTLITDNEGGSGAMLLNFSNTALLENVTISGNRGLNAILNDGGSTLTLLNCTVTENTGFTKDDMPIVGGIHDVHGGFGLTFLSNTILSGNGPGSSADDCRFATSLDGGNIIGDSERCMLKSLPSDQLDVDPGLSPLADHGGFTATHLPGPNAVDHGVAVACLETDQRGVARPLDGDSDGETRCDVGAVELLGNGGTPLLTFEPASLDFGEVEVGDTSPPQVATLHNSGTADATGVTFTPPDGGFDADTSACGTVLPPGTSCEVSLTFTPAAVGPVGAELHVDSAEGAERELALAGTGVDERWGRHPPTRRPVVDP